MRSASLWKRVRDCFFSAFVFLAEPCKHDARVNAFHADGWYVHRGPNDISLSPPRSVAAFEIVHRSIEKKKSKAWTRINAKGERG